MAWQLYLLFSACERRPKAALFNFSLRLEKTTASPASFLGFAMRAEYHSGLRKPPQPAQSLFMRGVAVKRRLFENGAGRKGNDMKAGPSRPRNDGLRVAIHLLLLTQIGNG